MKSMERNNEKRGKKFTPGKKEMKWKKKKNRLTSSGDFFYFYSEPKQDMKEPCGTDVSTSQL